MAKARGPSHGHHGIADPSLGGPLAEPDGGRSFRSLGPVAEQERLAASPNDPLTITGLDRWQIGPNLERELLISRCH